MHSQKWMSSERSQLISPLYGSCNEMSVDENGIFRMHFCFGTGQLNNVRKTHTNTHETHTHTINRPKFPRISTLVVFAALAHVVIELFFSLRTRSSAVVAVCYCFTFSRYPYAEAILHRLIATQYFVVPAGY